MGWRRKMTGKGKASLTAWLSLFAVLAAGSSSIGEPASPFPVGMTQGDGTKFEAILQGDEYYMHVETADGFTIIKDSDIWYFAREKGDGDIMPSGSRVGVDDPLAAALPKHIDRSHEVIERIRNFRSRNRIETRTEPLKTTSNQFQRPLTILADFDPSPYEHRYTRYQFYDLLYSVGTYPTGSMNDYFKEVSYGNFEFIAGPGDITDWIMAPRSYDWYCNGQSGMGGWPQNSQGLLVDLATVLDPDIDFSEYDMDGDGYVDAITIIVEGGMDGSADNFLAHAGRLNDHKILLDGVWIDLYDLVYEQSNGEIRPIGTFSHEYAHVLGLPDLYDKDRSSTGIGYWGLMAYGGWNTQTRPAHLSAWSKALLGWVTPVRIRDNSPDRIISNAEQNPVAFRLWTNGQSGDEYFLIENRQPLGFDENLMGHGLLIWHIDDGQPNNNDENHKKVDLEEADGEDDLDNYGNYGDEGDPFPGAGGRNNPNLEFSGSTYPDSRAYDGSLSQTAVKRIVQDGETVEADLYVRDPASVPTLSEWGLLILGLLLLAWGTVAIVKRQRPAAHAPA